MTAQRNFCLGNRLLIQDRQIVIIASDAMEAGFVWHDLIDWDQTTQRRLSLHGYSTIFYTNQKYAWRKNNEKSTFDNSYRDGSNHNMFELSGL
jgi:hypothetical protein